LDAIAEIIYFWRIDRVVYVNVIIDPFFADSINDEAGTDIRVLVCWFNYFSCKPPITTKD